MCTTSVLLWRNLELDLLFGQNPDQGVCDSLGGGGESFLFIFVGAMSCHWVLKRADWMQAFVTFLTFAPTVSLTKPGTSGLKDDPSIQAGIGDVGAESLIWSLLIASRADS